LAAATGERQIKHARLINNKQVGARPDGRCNTRRNYELQIITENEADSTLFKQVITDSCHVFHQLLPPLLSASQHHSLRDRTHQFHLQDVLWILTF